MTKANECTCPSGDGSLRHPCPAHPALVEQAGGDERASKPGLFCRDCGSRLMVRGVCSIYCPKCEKGDGGSDNSGVPAEAAVPESVALLYRRSDGNDRAWSVTCDPHYMEFFRKADGYESKLLVDAALAQPSPCIHDKMRSARSAAIESLRSLSHEELVERAEKNAQPSPAQAEQAEAERPEQPKRHTADVFYHNHFSTVQMEVVRASDFDEFAAQHERISAQLHDALDECDGDRWKLRSERDAALAEVKRNKLTIAAMNEAHAKLAADLEAVQARVAELEKQEPAGAPMPDEIHQMAFEEGQPAEDGDGYLFSAEEFDLFVQRLLDSCAAPVAQAQHSVPEWTSSKPAVEGAYWVRGNGLVEPFVVLVKLDQGELWCNLHMRNTDTNFGYGYAVDDLSSEFEWCGPLAAATGRSVPQAWLDVQAERRRQVEAEGWTPEHDDLYCAAELPRAAAAYILSGANDEAPAIWPFLAKWWKPRDARANYMRAGALILAEIERLDRAAAPGKEGV